MRAAVVRNIAYGILLHHYNRRMTAGEIARNSNGQVTRKQVHHALRNFARVSRQFAIFPDPAANRIYYSIYP